MATRPRRAHPGPQHGGPAIDPTTGQPIVAPGTDGNRSVSDPSQVDPAKAPSGGDVAPAEFSKEGSQSGPKPVLPEDKLRGIPTKLDGSKGDRELSETEKKEARKIAAVLEEVNSGKRTMEEVRETYKEPHKWRLKPMVGKHAVYWETTLVSDDGAGRGSSKMRLLFKYDETRKKAWGTWIVQMHDQT